YRQAILDPIWRALNIGRDNKGLLIAQAGRIIKVNALLLDLCGRSLGELIGRKLASELFACSPTAERWQTVLKTAAAEPIAIEVTRQSLAPDLGEFEVYAIRDLRGRQQALESQARHSRALRQREEELRLHKEKLDAALDNMLQGLAMFDAEQRLIVCNRRYAEMYGLTAEQVRPGTTVRQIFEYRLANGFYHVKDSESFVGSWTSSFGDASARIQELADGRIISVVRRQMPNGGRIVTHEDITERQKLNAQLQRQHQHLRQQEEKLRAQNLQLDVALNNMSQGLCLFDANQRVVIANRRYADMYGISPDLLREGTSLQQILEARASVGLYDNEAARQWAHDGLLNAHKQAADIVPLSDGRLVCVLRRQVAGGGLVSTHEDVTERERLREQLDTALNNMAQGLAMFDAELRLVVANRRYAEIYGFEPAELRPGTQLRQLVERRLGKDGHAGKTFDEMLRPLGAAGSNRQASEHVTELADGRFVAVSIQPMANGGMVTTHQDITEQRRSEAKIAHMALHDALTNLPNRVLLNERLEHALARSRRGEIVATHILDLDHFKHVNDTLGHPVGDKLLQMVANRLRALVRNTDTVARMGGDEFAIVQVALSQVVDATSLAQRVIAALSEPYEVDGHQVVIGTSVGITLAPSDGLIPEQLIRNGDLALYRAKGDGRGTFRFFESEMDVQMQARRTLEQDLRKALIAGELELHYQPVINIASGRISGLEALVRWQHPENGLVAPATFIPLAEETGLIVPIGEWVIREACATAAQWPADVRIAVNLSPAQLRNPALPQTLVSALAASGLAPDRLELEITETVLLHDSAATLAILFRLRELGVRIAMDDFGTGYSSLSHLQRFPFDKIKIDRSFINNIAADVSSLNIVRAVAALASGLGVAATAEGVETREQFDLIRSEGCTEMQGFLLSKPVPSNELEPLFLAKGIEREAARQVVAA
ncbi:MAG TPA: PAS-domain containing protein, partial [Hyphomicrobiaceae bacterium]|nr:PAS-domain containing protein [Hyphomicrobiaceae bacterium]